LRLTLIACSNDPVLTGVPFNDSYRYMDWLLTEPVLVMEIVLCMTLTPEQSRSKCITLCTAAIIMIIAGCPGELIVSGDLNISWTYWGFAMVPFLYVVDELLVGLSAAMNAETNSDVKDFIFRAQWVTVTIG